MSGYDGLGGGKASAPKVTCPVCGAVYLQHWMSVRFVYADGQEALTHHRNDADVRRTDTHVLACERKQQHA